MQLYSISNQSTELCTEDVRISLYPLLLGKERCWLPSDMNIPYMDPSAFEKKVLGPSKPSVSNHRTKCLGTTRDLNITVLLIFVAENRSSIA